MTQPDSRPTFAMLCDWLEGRLDEDTANSVAAAVETDDEGRLRPSVEWLQGFLTVGRELPLHTPPPIVRQRLQQHFTRWSKAREAMNAPPLFVTADLLFDSRKDLVGAGLRTAGIQPAVHLGYGSDVADVVLDAHPTPDGRLRLNGQVLPTSETAPVFAASVESATFSATVLDGDDLGHFSVNGVPRELITVKLSNGEMTLELRADLSDIP
jgi:hypothetical protein